MGHNNISTAVYYGSLTSILLGYIKDHVHHIHPSYNDTVCVCANLIQTHNDDKSAL